MSKEATIIQSFNDAKRQYEYFVKGYDVTESVGILLKRHKEAYDKEKKVFAGIDGYLEAQKEYQSQIADLQQQLADTKAKLETAEYWNNKYDDCQQQLTITEKALELACKKVEERYTCSELAEGYGCNLNYFKIKAREMLENE